MTLNRSNNRQGTEQVTLDEKLVSGAGTYALENFQDPAGLLQLVVQRLGPDGDLLHRQEVDALGHGVHLQSSKPR